MSLDEFAQELDNRDDDDESNLFIEGMFGGLLTVPLPVPEILSSLDKTKSNTSMNELSPASFENKSFL